MNATIVNLIIQLLSGAAGGNIIGNIVEEPETVLLIKTQAGYRDAIESAIRQRINYTNLIAEIAPESTNENFVKWLNAEVATIPPQKGTLV